MTPPVTLRATTATPVFWRGENIVVRVALTTAEDAAPVEVPVPFALFQPGITVVVLSPDGNETLLRSQHTGVGQSISLPPGDRREAELLFAGVHAFEPGHYEVRVEWQPRGMSTLVDTVLSDSVSFDVVEPTAMTLGLVDVGGVDAPGARTTGTVSGSGVGALLELQFGTDIEDDTNYLCTRSVKRVVRTEPLTAAIPVQPAPAAADWVAGRDAAGVFARAGIEMKGVARHDWPDDDAPHVVVPAFESAAGLRLFTLTRAGQLSAIDFAPPRIEIEQPTGPDDWDDEVLVPGDVALAELGRIGEGVLGARAVGGNDEVRIVAVARGALLHARVQGRALSASGRVELDARVLSTDPAVRLDGDVASAAVVVAREAPDHPDLLQVGLALVRFEATPQLSYRWLGVLESIPVSAAVSFAPAADGTWPAMCAVLDTERVLHIGTWAESWSGYVAPSTLLSPLTITALLEAPHVAVATPEGPRLQRL